MRHFRATAVLLLLIALFVSSQAAADRVKVRAAQHDDFLRIVFDWKAPVDYVAELDGRVLKVTFGRPIEASLQAIEKNLGDQVASAKIDVSGRGVRIILKQDFKLRHFVLNGSIVADLVGSVAAVGESGTVRVRFGEHDDFTRAVFDWDERVSYSVEKADGSVVIRFGRRAKIDLSAAAGGGENIASVAVEEAEDETIVRFTVPRGARINHFRDGPRVALDIRDAPDLPPAGSVVAAPIEAVQVEAVPGLPRPGRPGGAVGTPVQIAPNFPALSGSAITPDVAVDSTAPLRQGPDGGSVLPVNFVAKGDGGVLRFVGGKGRPAAVFARNGWTWVVIEQAGTVNVARLRVEARGVLDGIEQVTDSAATILRFKVKPRLNPVALVDVDDWLVDFAVRPSRPVVAITNEIRTEASRSRFLLHLDAAAAGQPLKLSDPEIGDGVLVVPVVLASYGVTLGQRFIDFDVLPTTQGIVLVPRRENIAVSLAAGGLAVDVRSGGGLHVTPQADRETLSGSGSQLVALPRVFEFGVWSREHEPDFNTAKLALQNELINAPSMARDERRLALAQFYFARGFIDRSLGVLETIARGNPGVASSPEFVALRGATRLLSGDLEGASGDLNNASLDDEPEVYFWRAALMAEFGEYSSAAVGMRMGLSYTSRYPDDLRLRFALLGADTGLKAEEPGAARAWLVSLDDLGLEGDKANLVRVLGAQALVLEGDADGALAIFDDIVARGDRRSRAVAMLARTELLLAREALTVAEAIEALESLRFVWRGDFLEFNVLRRLGELQLESGSFQQGLQTLKRATSNFEGHPNVGEITARMQSVFVTLFLEGDADGIAPVKAIALFNEFRELTPSGATGDRMIRLLADRLVQVDLLEQAGGLLQHQIEFRIVDAAERAEVGARLAVLRLLDRRPVGAVEALDSTAVPGLRDELVEERDVIRARAMAELGEVDAAIALLAEISSEDANRLRVGILWDIQDWQRAAIALSDLVQPQARLTDGEARDVLRRAIALSLGGEGEILAQVRREFGVAMLSTPFAIDFRIVTSNEGSAADIRTAIQRVAAVDDFREFMEQYRGRASGNASLLN